MSSSVNRIRYFVLGTALVFLASMTGCGDGNTVEGVVTYKGQPLEGASVTYMANDGTVAGQGVTDASGKYKLLDSKGKTGIPAGSYTVTVTKTEGTGGGGVKVDPSEGISKDYLKNMMKGKFTPKSLVPAEFSNSKSSPLKKTVPSGDYKLDLGDK